MASHPYISGPGNITQMIGFLRKNFPATVTSETVKKLQLASNNESYVINALQFLGVIDDEGKRTERGHKVFLLPNGDFEKEFEEILRDAYFDLFDVRGDDAWKMSKAELTGYFRTTDKTSDVIGGRQAAVFLAFRGLTGRDPDLPTKARVTTPAVSRISVSKSAKAKKPETPATSVAVPGPAKSHSRRDMALTVRVEINLPAEGSAETYDNIFKSIKAHLIDE